MSYYKSRLCQNLKFTLCSVAAFYTQDDADKLLLKPNDKASTVFFNGSSKDRLHKQIGKAIKESRSFVSNYRDLNGVPGLVIGISYKGNPLWVQGFGYSNIELNAKCNKDTVMRIASISKSVTMLLVAKLVEQNKLDLNKSIYDYLDSSKFPVKYFEGKKVDITLGQLVSHTSGIRSYKKLKIDDKDVDEFYLNKTFANVTESLSLFKEDDLVSKPGSTFLYSSLTWSLVSAVIESVLPNSTSFEKALIEDVCRKDLGMLSTYLDENSPIIANRSAQYQVKDGTIINAPCVDNSYKWAGGGILSTVSDLLKFGNVMLYSFKGGKDGLKGYLKPSTVEIFWTPEPLSSVNSIKEYKPWTKYGMGWSLLRDCKASCVNCLVPPFKNIIFHTGHSIGGCSCLIILPEEEIVVAVMVNVEKPSLTFPLCIKVGQIFASHINSTFRQFFKNTE